MTVLLHDPDLPRLTGNEGLVRDCTAAELGRLPLVGGPESVPTLLEALKLVGRLASSATSPPSLSRPRVLELKAQGAALLCWTITTPVAERKAWAVAGNITFEG